MALPSMVDVRISPDGERVAYVVSQPNVEKASYTAHSPLTFAARVTTPLLIGSRRKRRSE